MVHTVIIFWLIGFLTSMNVLEYGDKTWSEVFVLLYKWPVLLYKRLKEKYTRLKSKLTAPDVLYLVINVADVHPVLLDVCHNKKKAESLLQLYQSRFNESDIIEMVEIKINDLTDIIWTAYPNDKEEGYTYQENKKWFELRKNIFFDEPIL